MELYNTLLVLSMEFSDDQHHKSSRSETFTCFDQSEGQMKMLNQHSQKEH